jgi:hypothetical protein
VVLSEDINALASISTPFSFFSNVPKNILIIKIMVIIYEVRNIFMGKNVEKGLNEIEKYNYLINQKLI